MITQEKYKGFNLEFDICRSGFNTYTVTIKRFKGYEKDLKSYNWYFLEIFQTITSKKAVARKEVKKYIDNLKSFKWDWNAIRTYNPKTDNINRIKVLK